LLCLHFQPISQVVCLGPNSFTLEETLS